MSRSTDKHPDKVCPRGRSRCGVCSHSRATRRRALADAPTDEVAELKQLHDFNDRLAELVASGRFRV